MEDYSLFSDFMVKTVDVDHLTLFPLSYCVQSSTKLERGISSIRSSGTPMDSFPCVFHGASVSTQGKSKERKTFRTKEHPVCAVLRQGSAEKMERDRV